METYEEVPRSSGGSAMVESRYGLKFRPFPTTPDSACYYPATAHENALGHLLKGIREEEGILLLVADPGMGKSLMAQILLERLEEKWASSLVTNTHLADRKSLYQAILFDLGLPYDGDTEQVLRLRLTDFLLRNCQDGKKTLIVVDEAQHLSVDLLEELRLLGNLEAGMGKAVQVLLVGQTSLLRRLEEPELASLQQRLAIRTALQPMDVEESYDYLLFHLRLAGGKPEKFVEEDALEMLARSCQGVPRLLNQAGHWMLALSEENELEKVDLEAAQEALEQLGLTIEAEIEDEPGLPSVAGTLDQDRVKKSA